MTGQQLILVEAGDGYMRFIMLFFYFCIYFKYSIRKRNLKDARATWCSVDRVEKECVECFLEEAVIWV